MYQKYFKRALDIIISLTLLILFCWLFLLIMVIIKFTTKGPIIFQQKRIGVNKKVFNIYKFRTMSIDTPKEIPTHLMNNPMQYITSVGRVLRKTSLDELPQLINILKGDMSLVGPRPALWNQVDLINERDKYGANDILPGLTGLAQISGRDELEIKLKALYDGKYKKNISFHFDCWILIKTVGSVLCRKGVKEGGMGSM